jgi:small subunit ribosomal protein S18
MKRATTTKKRPKSEPAAHKQSRHLEGVKSIDCQDYDMLRKFVTDHGKIIPARLTGATAKQQRQIKHGVRRARETGLLG